MKLNAYIISYVSNSGIVILNDIVVASSRGEAIELIKNDTGVSTILSIYSV